MPLQRAVLISCLALIVPSAASAQVEVPSAYGREATPAVINPPIASPCRTTVRLNGTWDFATDPNKVGYYNRWNWPKPTDSPWGKATIQVPGCWEARGVGGPGEKISKTPEQVRLMLSGSYIGDAWYRREVAIPSDWAGKQVWLKIGGVHAQGWFWVNGVYVGHDACYCGAYKYNITDLVKPGEKAIVVAKVANDVPSGKGAIAAMQRFGGFYRDVEIEATSVVSIDDVYVVGDLDKRSASVRVKLRCVGSPPSAGDWQTIVAVSTLDGSPVGQAAAKVVFNGKDTQELVVELPLEPFRAWSPEQPNLYKAEVVLKADGKALDGWTERFGVRKWEVRGDYFYLNNQKYFIRGFGDDYTYPLTMCSPASRDVHRQHLKLAKQYGFNYVRHHTHCESPEFYDAADEVGIMIQPELPYYGLRWLSAGAPDFFRPKEDLLELYRHYRRYVSFSTYSFGNEGHLGSPLDREMYQLAKKLDPTRLVLHHDGGVNVPGNSDFASGPYLPWAPGTFHGRRPFVCHEYLNLATDYDPRLAERYTGAVRLVDPVVEFRTELKRVGLSWEWGVACIDAGHHLQSVYQKRGLESARLDPACGGYSYWTILDWGSFGITSYVGAAAQGLFNQFWEPKASSAEFFRQFNSPTVLLAKMTPGEQILSVGDVLRVEWWISHFGWDSVNGQTLKWRLTANDQALASGSVSDINALAGDVKAVGNSAITIPSVDKPVKARLVVELADTGVTNSWDLWLFPKRRPAPHLGIGLAAPKRIHAMLVDRYPGISHCERGRADKCQGRRDRFH